MPLGVQGKRERQRQLDRVKTMLISLSVATSLILVSGLIIIGIVALRPRMFWPILIFVVVGTLGLMVQGYCLVDEYLTGCVLIGGLLAISVGAVSRRRQPIDKINYLHMLLFSLMIIYLLVESVRGLLLWEDLRLSRWIIYYGMLGVISLLISRWDFPAPSARNISLIVSCSTLLYFVAYLGQGVYVEAFQGISRFATQGKDWSGSAYAMFPIVVAIPAAIYLLRDCARKWRWLGLALIVISVMVAYYYDSRTSYLVIIVFLVFSPFVLGFLRVAPFLVLFLGILGWLYCFGNWEGFVGQVQTYTKNLADSAALLWSPRQSDVDRYVHMHASFITVGANLATWLFGYGVHSHRFVIGPYLKELYAGMPGVDINVGNLVRTEAFETLLVDTGFIGMLLLAMNFLFVAASLFAQRSPMRIMLLPALVITFLWLFISNIQDIVLLYLIIMPMGPLVLLGQRRTDKQALNSLAS